MPCRPACSTWPMADEHAPNTSRCARGMKTKLMEEKTALGFFFPAIPTIRARRSFVALHARSTAWSRRRIHQYLAGIVVGIRTQMTRRGKMLFVQIDDGTMVEEVGVQRSCSRPSATRSSTDEVLVIEGKVRYDEFSAVMPWSPSA